ncbi:AIPR protein [Leptolyngbya sp. PCC 7375]|nr:AIPR protein [Leptolyngbya sp. PCC 7375]
MASNSNTSKFAVKQLQGEIKKLFEDLIDLTDLENTRINKEIAFLSRGFAAYTLYSLAGISASEAAESVVDGKGDNGIDAIFWHKSDNILWLVQSKWIQKGAGQPEYSGINTFSTGVRNLIEDNLDRPNYRLFHKKEEAERALATIGVKVNLLIAHTGQGISKMSRKCLDDLVQDLNINESDDDAFRYQVFDKDIAYKHAVENANKLNIETEFNLSNWGKMDAPYTAFYGQVSALDLAKLWLEHRNNLFANNLRDFIGRTKANDDINQTLKEDPASFWYFNNGVTILCNDLRRKTKGIKRLNDDFFCKGISIINGAQTIGSIGRFYEENPKDSEENLEQVEVFVKLISLDGCPEDFGVKVTRATNTQNHVEDRDFLALDPIQQKIARELKAWDRSKTYFYKRSAEMVSSETSCTLTEVTKAIACCSSDVKLAAITKKDISEIWSDTSSSLYKRIFNSSVSPIKLWRSVEVYRFVEDYLNLKAKESKMLKKITTHADLFIIHLVFEEINNKHISVFQDDLKSEDYDLLLPSIIESQLENVQQKLEKFPASTRLGIFFKNPNKCTALKREIIES